MGLLAVPGTAEAATFRGETSQGRPAKLRAGADGPNYFSLRWRLNCTNNLYINTRTRFEPEFKQRTPDRLVDGGSYASPVDDQGYKFRAQVRVDATRASATRWTGTFRAKAVVRRRGAIVGRCAAKTISWQVTR